jgi:hypothetical protein
MSDKDLQRLTNSVGDIDHGPSPRRALPPRRRHITQKFKIAGQRTLYISVHDHEEPAEIFLRLRSPDCSSELIGLYDVLARLPNIAFRCGPPPGEGW